jgi:hypothetical protein
LGVGLMLTVLLPGATVARSQYGYR